MSEDRIITRFQRINLAFGCALLGATFAAYKANAQTFDEAVRMNVALALQLCNTPGWNGNLRASQFRAAGFSERVDRSTVNSDTTHFFNAPADTVSVEFYYGEMPEHCIVTSNHLSASDASAVLDSVIPRLYPGFLRKVQQGAINPATGRSAQCVTYEDPTNPIGLIIGVGAGNNATGCVDNGSSVFFSSYRV